LAPYNEGKRQLEADLATIRQHYERHPIMKDLVENKAMPEIVKIQAYFESQNALVKQGKADEARVHLNDGKAAVDAFRAVNILIEQDVEKLINDDYNASHEASAQSKTVILIGGAVSVLLALVSGFLLARAIVRPLSTVNQQLSEIADGGGDLTREIVVANNDEVADLANSFNRMTAQLRDMIRQVTLTAQQVAASAEELSASADQTKSATEQIANSIQQMASGTETQAHNVEESANQMNEMSSGAQQVATNANAVAVNANHAAQIAQQGNLTIQTAVTQMSSINHTIEELSQVVAGLDERSEEITQIIEVITSIAAQTNLLALNAAIEASRAGEQGRGFAVVADEVRVLAEQSSGSARQIAELIRTIQIETHKAVQSMENGRKEVTQGIGVVNTAGHSFEEILDSVQNVANQIEGVSAASEQISASSQQVVASIHLIADVAEEVASGTQNVSAVTEEQLASMEEIAASANSLSQMADSLQELVGKFKV
jgi:methyl-accepting chemotaxis protein